jgi:hypothetical protein
MIEEVLSAKCQLLKSGKPGGQPSASSYFSLGTSNSRRNAGCRRLIMLNKANSSNATYPPSHYSSPTPIVPNKPNSGQPDRCPGGDCAKQSQTWAGWDVWAKAITVCAAARSPCRCHRAQPRQTNPICTGPKRSVGHTPLCKGVRLRQTNPIRAGPVAPTGPNVRNKAKGP